MMGAPPNLPPAPGGGMSLVPGMSGYPPGMVPQFMTVPPPGFGSFKPVSISLLIIFFCLISIIFFVYKDGELSEWTQHVSPDRRVYYYNTTTKESSWVKPDELLTAAERLLTVCPWKEYRSDMGKVYYHNVTTKESTWETPQEIIEITAKIAAEQ